VEFIVLLGTPLLGALTLSMLGGRRWAPEANVAFSLITFFCGLCAHSTGHCARQFVCGARAILHRCL